MAFPEKIKMKGLPFMMQGWNNVYERTGEVSDGCPVYSLAPYNLYFVIAIIGVKIMRVGGIWVLKRDCDLSHMSFRKYGYGPQGDPFGHWSNGGFVVPKS